MGAAEILVEAGVFIHATRDAVAVSGESCPARFWERSFHHYNGRLRTQDKQLYEASLENNLFGPIHSNLYRGSFIVSRNLV
jgi:hypothetical protein